MTIKMRLDRNAVALFNTKDGTKIRFSVGKYEKAKWPELVDIKISDFCPLGCSFCYQDSTIFGKHASMHNMNTIIQRLADRKVFEVALGGGEPTLHPQFVDILWAFSDAGIVPNFTTRIPANVRRVWTLIKDVVGGFAYSADTPEQILSAARLLDGFIPPDKVALHYVMGLGDRDHFEEFLATAHQVGWRVTLLGYKTSGRGSKVIPQDYSWWVDSVSSLIRQGVCPSLSIDTPLAEQYDGKMPVASYMYHTREGAFSMYIDAVSMEMGASSFDSKTALVPFDASWVSRYQEL